MRDQSGSTMKRHATRLIYISFVFALIGGAVLLRYMDPFFVRSLRLIAYDHLQRLDPEPYNPNLPIRIVDIDEKSLSVIGQWPWPRTTVRDLLLELTSKGAAVVAFDVLFAEPDRTSLEAIVKQLPASEAAAITSAMAGRPSNDELFAAALKDTPSVLSVVLGEGANATLEPKAGFAVAGDDPRPFLQAFKGASQNLAELENAARGIGAFNWVADRDQIVRHVSLMFRLDQTLVPSLAAEALRIAQGATSYLLKASNASGETAFGQSTGLNHIRIGDVEYLRMVQEGCISNSATSPRRRIFPLGRCWPEKFRRKRSRAGLFLSEPAPRACLTCGQPQSTRLCPGSIFMLRYSSIC